MRKNKSCLKIRGLVPNEAYIKICELCGFTTSTINNIKSHTCREEYITLFNKNKLLNVNIYNLNNKIKSNNLDNKNIVTELKNEITSLKNNINNLHYKLKKSDKNNMKYINETFNLERKLEDEISENKNNLLHLASKSTIVNKSTYNNSTNTTNHIQMLIGKLEPIQEKYLRDLSYSLCTNEVMLNGTDSLMESYAISLKDNRMLCTDSNRKILTYKNEEGEVVKDKGGKKLIPKICELSQPAVDEGYIRAEQVIKTRTENEDDYDIQMKYLDKEWKYKYPRMKTGMMSDKDISKISTILAEGVKVSNEI